MASQNYYLKIIPTLGFNKNLQIIASVQRALIISTPAGFSKLPLYDGESGEETACLQRGLGLFSFSPLSKLQAGHRCRF